MGFNTVYRFLSEIFPQIDARLLKAVAIEHSKDADAAANAVLTEILPYWAKQSVTSSSLPDNQSASSSPSTDQIASICSSEKQSASSSSFRGQSLTDLSDGDGEHEEQITLSRRRRMVAKLSKNASTSPEPREIISGNATNTDSTQIQYTDSASLRKTLDASTDEHFYDANDGRNQLFGNNESEEVILLGRRKENGNEVGSNKVSAVMRCPGGIIGDVPDACSYVESGESVSSDKGQDIDVKVGPELNLLAATSLINENIFDHGSLPDRKASDVSPDTDFDTSICGKGEQEESCLRCPLVVLEDTVTQMAPSSVQDHTPDGSGSDLQSEILSGTCTTDCEKQDVSDSSDMKSNKENASIEKDTTEDELTVNSVITRSGQIFRIDLLEEIIEDAKNNKKTLFLAMESVMNMMREVELQEKAAEESKIEAARGGSDILIKVEELKSVLAQAKAANDMHAGEVYGEKAILATEVRELQSRLLILSEERDKSLAILDEMHETLEGRLAVAEEVKKAAEEEKLGKEESARKSLAELEAIMEKVVQESKILQQEAEENSKLREFLMDRGRVVDSLQGEISVICQDVKLLKEKFDDCVPLSKSVSSSQTTCILASSGSSSIKSLASLAAEQALTSETTREGSSPSASIHVQSPKSSLGDERSGADHRELLDDGWDFFDKDTELYDKF